MEIRKIERINPESGELEVFMALTKEQTQLLIEFAINTLVAQGMASIILEQPQEAETSGETLEQARERVVEEGKEFLAGAPVDILHKA